MSDHAKIYVGKAGSNSRSISRPTTSILTPNTAVEIGDDSEAQAAEPSFHGKTYRGNPMTDPVKMVMVVREDLGMTPGKVATQVEGPHPMLC